VALELLEDRGAVRKTQVIELARATEHARVQSARETERAARFRGPPRVNLRECLVGREHPLDQHLDAPAGLLLPEEARLR
jgi:hypothetical protein